MSAAVASAMLAGEGPRAKHELDLVRGAIDLIASGGARRVTMVAMHYAEAILPTAQALAREHGVIVRAVWREAGSGCDIAVEPVG
jgi:hypothetical protein